MDCLFCKIIKKELPAEIVYEDETILAFKDIHPKAPFHILIVPKKHIDSIKSNGAERVVGGLVSVAKEIAQKRKIEGYKLVFNVGKEGGQVVNHLHLHLLVGKPVEMP
ncbi:histidine triad nucleotide-binding protein [bacterium]|nr:histidine triad nucleotide-binding protein [bacterium]